MDLPSFAKAAASLTSYSAQFQHDANHRRVEYGVPQSISSGGGEPLPLMDADPKPSEVALS